MSNELFGLLLPSDTSNEVGDASSNNDGMNPESLTENMNTTDEDIVIVQKKTPSQSRPVDPALELLRSKDLSAELESTFGIRPSRGNTNAKTPSIKTLSRKERYQGASSRPISHKPRLLCLHGGGANNTIASFQTVGLKLSSQFECVFLHAPHATDCFPGLEEMSGPFYCWGEVDNWETQWDESLEYLASFCRENGPFDGVYAFSQAVSVVTNFSHSSIWKDRFNMDQIPWKYAILACGTCDHMMTVGNDIAIDLPSFHILGLSDEYLDETKTLVSCWDRALSKIGSHVGGHSIDAKMWARELGLMNELTGFLDKQLHPAKEKAAGFKESNFHSEKEEDARVQLRLRYLEGKRRKLGLQAGMV